MAMIDLVKKTIGNLSVLLLLSLLAGCQSNSTHEQQLKGDTSLADTLPYEYTDYIQFSDNLVTTTETTDTTYFAASYPVFTDSTINQFVQSALLGNDTASVEKTAAQFISEFDRFHRSDPFPRVWVSESHAKVYRITPSFLEIVIDVFSFTGGAHGNYARIFRHYDLASKQLLKLHDVVSATYQNELTAVAERYFRQQENLTVDQSLQDRYFFDEGKFHIPDNFALEGDSLLFLYNIYEIKPYVDGQTELRIPYSDIERLLTGRARQIINELHK